MSDMILNKKFSPGLMASLLSAGTLVVCGCSNENSLNDEPGMEEGIPTEVSFSMEALRSDDNSDGTLSDPASDNEKINSWWIAFVDHSGTVRKIVNREASGAVEMETFKCTVPSGVYSLYAFANINPNELKTATGVEFVAGKSITLPSGVTKLDDAVWNTSLNNWDAAKPLPMSGFIKELRVKNTIEETFSIEVVRMAAKMEFVFSNSSDEEVTVKSITVDPVTTSSISLFPKGSSGISYDHLGQSTFTPLANPQYGKAVFSLSSDNVIAAGEEKKSKSLYFQESLSDRENDKAFTVGLTVRHKSGVSDFEQYNITRDILSYINRNDHIVIPMAISRYAVDVEAVFYPPIGGYPTAISDVNPEGAQIFTFSTEGDFAIVPHIFDKQTGRHLAPVFYTISLSNISDPNNIFSTGNPKIVTASTSLPDVVTGTLKNVKGKASLELTVTIYDKPHYEAGAKATESYTRKIYIIRD